MTTNDDNLLAPNFPIVEILDKYGSVVQGNLAKGVEIHAKMFQSEASLFGATVAKADSSGQALFNGLGLQGTPGTSHSLKFESVLADSKRLLTTSTLLSTRIQVCGENLYSDSNLQQCAKCPVGTTTRQQVGATHIDQCYCIERTFGNASSSCKSCLRHATCRGGDTLNVWTGYWRSSPKSLAIHECRFIPACLGYANPFVKQVRVRFPNDTMNYNESCATGYTGNLCFSCEAGYSRKAKAQCQQCPTNHL